MQSNSDTFFEERESAPIDENDYIQWESEQMDRLNISPLQPFENGLTKTDINTLAAKAVNNVLETGDPLKVAESLSAMELFIKEVKADKRFTDYVREEAAKTPKGFVSKSGAKVELAETGTSYDFSQCNDLVYEGLIEDKKKIDFLLKEREKFLKTITVGGLTVTDENTGETTKIFAPAKSSNSSFKVTLAK